MMVRAPYVTLLITGAFAWSNTPKEIKKMVLTNPATLGRPPFC